MQFDNHGNGNGLDDLYVLPETQEEAGKIERFLRAEGMGCRWEISDVAGQSWFGKQFVRIFFLFNNEFFKDRLRRAVA